MGSSLRFLIRDLFLGCNSQVQDFERALLLASTDEDSKWLCKIFSAVPKCAEDAKEILLRYSDDVRALSFAAFVVNSSFPDFDLLSKCAEKEDPFALAVMATKVNVSQGRIMAKKAAKAGERDAFFVLGQSWVVSKWGAWNIEKAKKHFLTAAMLGHVDSMEQFGRFCPVDDPLCWLWLGRAAKDARTVYFWSRFSDQVEKMEFGLPVLEIGRALKGNVANGLIFGKVPLKETDLSAAKIAIDFFDAQMGCARRAVDAWTAVAIRLMVVKDIRRLIGMLIWEERNNFGMWLLKREEKVA